jgi:hypothetical protein
MLQTVAKAGLWGMPFFSGEDETMKRLRIYARGSILVLLAATAMAAGRVREPCTFL